MYPRFTIFTLSIAFVLSALLFGVFIMLEPPVIVSAQAGTGNICTVISVEDSGVGTLRQCLLDAEEGGTINFDTSVFSKTVPVTIFLLTPLPEITENSITLDGTTVNVAIDGGSLLNGNGLVLNGTEGVLVRGLIVQKFPRSGILLVNGARNNSIGEFFNNGENNRAYSNIVQENRESGLLIRDSDTMSNTVAGNLIIRNAEDGIEINLGAKANIIGPRNAILLNGGRGLVMRDSGTESNLVIGNFIGLDPEGTIENGGNSSSGIQIRDGAGKNIVGGVGPHKRNIIGNQEGSGIFISHSSDNQIQGNYIGTDPTGKKSQGNSNGITVNENAMRNIIGGLQPEMKNLISGNNRTGIVIWGEDTAENQVLGNYVGIDISGKNALPNLQDGINIGEGATNNTVGGVSELARNIVSGNGDDGFTIQDDGTDNNLIIGNYIGTDVTGMEDVGNALIGILVISSDSTGGPNGTQIGGSKPGMGNLISGNGHHGVLLRDPGTAFTVIQGNFIGTAIDGKSKLPNDSDGVHIFMGSNHNTIGGQGSNARNIISGNGNAFNSFTEAGVWIEGLGSSDNLIQGNYIGVDITGESALGNANFGVYIGSEASNNIVGGSSPDMGNLISGNQSYGIVIENVGTTQNRVKGNLIGTDINGKSSIPNLGSGIFIADSASNNIIGGTSPDERNIISGNGDPASSFDGAGVWIWGSGTTNNFVTGNYIGVDVTGSQMLGNSLWGIFIGLEAKENVIGGVTASERNVISGNGNTGIIIQDNGATQNIIAGNYIGTDHTGTFALPNIFGVLLLRSAENNVGGESTELGNLISGNSSVGIFLSGEDTEKNQIRNNIIGSSMDGVQPLPNNEFGIILGTDSANNVIGGKDNWGNLISGNGSISISLSAGIYITNSLSNEISHNLIGTTLNKADPLPNIGQGIYIGGGSISNTIGISNSIAYNTLDGISFESPSEIGNEITRNSIYMNGGRPIAWLSTDFPTGESQPLQILRYESDENTLNGQGCSGCRIELYANPQPDAGGLIFIGETKADETGSFFLKLPENLPYHYISAVQIAADNTTFGFSAGFNIAGYELFVPLVTTDPLTNTQAIPQSPLIEVDIASASLRQVDLGHTQMNQIRAASSNYGQ